MRAHQKSQPSMWAQAFGFFALALILSTADCRFNRLKAETVIPNPCSEEHLRMLYGDSWHIFYALNGCWIYDAPTTFAPRRFVIGGHR